MKWFRSNIKSGSRLALFALAIQFALSFGHFHGEIAHAAPAVQAALNDAGDDIAATLTAAEVPSEVAQQQPPAPDTDRHGSDCAMCAVLSLANTFVFATPPLLELPQAVQLLHVSTDAGFAHLGSLHSAFQSRAPPTS
ncbi:DUF2946 family protein [Bradyrhizobium roseum]|uniref:DUF2946 family protein n=1 Tax=Bradyrhizobium roseum TaxID=3056648 RepID=UPI00260355F7|nr:DUF2946 family protein [Bradyrhizobium roseus]WKA30207.1 DUF2946 domain-containing protein [Bradyrhizobium roseus]